MLQHRVPKVSFCGERPLDHNFDDFGGPRSSVREFLDASGGVGDGIPESWAKGEGSPGAGL